MLLVGLVITIYLAQQKQIFKPKAFDSSALKDISFYFNGRLIHPLKLFGQEKITETSRNIVSGRKIYHASGVIVDQSSIPNKVYILDSGNNRVLGFNGVGFCRGDRKSCNNDSDCAGQGSCQAEGTKEADLVIGQQDFKSAACNRDNNLGTNKKPQADTLCLLGYPGIANTAEYWLRSNLDVDKQGNLYVVDLWNNRVLKYNQPFSSDKSSGKGDSVADFVFGQNDFESNGINRRKSAYVAENSTPSPGKNGLYLSNGDFAAASRGVSVDKDDYVWIADTFNRRVLRFPQDSKDADLVIGQSDFNSVDQGSGCFSSSDFNSIPLNRTCLPVLARINPETGELYVLEEYNGPFMARILVFKPPFTNGMSAYKVIVPKEGPELGEWGNKYLFQATGFVFNQYKTGDYSKGVIWVNEHQTNRTVLLDKDGNIIKVIGAPDNRSRGGDTAYGGECGNIYDENQFNLWWPGGSIGFDNSNNIYLADEFFNRVSRYTLPYNPVLKGNRTCLPSSSGGIFKGLSPNLQGKEKLGEAVGVAVYEGPGISQLIVMDEGSVGRLKVWNNYLNQPSISASPDIVIDDRVSRRNLLSSAVDHLSRLWLRNEHGQLIVYQLPFKGNDKPIADFLKLYWPDGEEVDYGRNPGSVTFDTENKLMYLVDIDHNRILRIRNYENILSGNKLEVEMVIGQPGRNELRCNSGNSNPSAQTLCRPYNAKFDRFGNLFVVENNYECHGNDRVSVFTKEDLVQANGLFPRLSARKVFVAPDLNTKGPCGAKDNVGSPIGIAFNSRNEMILSNDGSYISYGGGNDSASGIRQLRQLWFYKNPLEKQIPDDFIELPMGAPGEITFDKSDNLVVQDHTWYRTWLINLEESSAPVLSSPVSSPISTPGTGTGFTLGAPSSVLPGENFRVKLLVRSDSEAANLFSAKIKFPADILEVREIITGNAIPVPADDIFKFFIKNWVENIYDNEAGTISLVGGVPNPGFLTKAGTKSGLMTEIVFSAKREGTATISFDNNSAIYSNEGNMNVLSQQTGVSIAVGTTTPQYKGDVNKDGKINLTDLSIMFSKWGKKESGVSLADLNEDGIVNVMDYSQMVKVLLENGVIKAR